MKVVTDVSYKNSKIIGYWRIESTDWSIKLENMLFYKEWGANTIAGAEVITLLEMLEVIRKKIKHIQQGSIKIGFDNWKAYKIIVAKVVKPTQYTQDGRAVIARIKQIINKAPIEIKLTLIAYSKRRSIIFQQNPAEYLLVIYDQRAYSMHDIID